ncbi:MarR family winged helix-turn-helix transcriptional regulator [Krasilnikoviella flava]|uniref:DNA-binding transcriptional regulator, MarR family n=1 Tax=Krasilnikoviella flava TaxID=526729 RepID=A0A1T5ILX7_9MICO|nr:MarR family winged helix-turn-helix transcriptional regulator [Krasilnikoviella flava]SKC40145.1 DNA-binding transcriptional regulator, MarR family [Krasilnikoviella flava]
MPSASTDAPARLSEDQQRSWSSVATLLMTLPATLDAQLRTDAGLNLFEYHVLVALGEAPDRTLGMSDLAALSRGSLSRLSHAVGRLERAGLVERSACSSGRRRMEARLTGAGWDKLVATAPGHVREVRRLVVDALDDRQLEALGVAADVVVRAIDPALACGERVSGCGPLAASGASGAVESAQQGR